MPRFHTRVAGLAAASFALTGGAAITTASASSATYGTPGVCKRVDTGLPLSLGTGSYVTRDGERVNAIDSGYAEGLAPRQPDLRVLRSNGRVRGLALCVGDRAAARLPLPKNRRARVVAMSANGNRVAWRTTVGTRGTLSVGVVKNRAARNVRSSTTAALFGRGSVERVEGRLVVAPDGSVAWSLPVGTRAGVWLWPSDAQPRRIAITKRSRVDGDASRDVWIVDDRHVLIGSGEEIARYGPRTPGHCPTGTGVKDVDVGPLAVRFSGGADLEQFGESTGWSHILICDPDVGDYTRVIPFSSSSSGIGSSGDVSESTGPTRVVYTAGTLIIERVTNEYGGGSTSTTNDALIADRDSRTPVRTTSDGGIAGPGLVPAPFAYSQPGYPAGPISVQAAPGAAAWTERDPRTGAITVWLADAAGTRPVGTATAVASSLPNGYTNPQYTGLSLAPGEVTWNTPTSTARAPITPTADSVFETASIAG